MSDKQNAGSIYYDVELETAQLLTGAKQVDATFDNMSSSASSVGKALAALDKNTKSAASSLNQMAGYAKSTDSSVQSLNTNVSAMAIAIQQANAQSATANMTLSQISGTLTALLNSLNLIASSTKAAASSTASAANEYSRAETIIEGLGNQLAVLDEAQENGARSAAILAAQLRLGSSATDAEKQKVAELTGQLYDMKNGTDTGAKSHVNWKNSMQQAGYQVQDFIVQVQGGQSALVAFSQQGSQLAGAFGPEGAVIGAVIALSTVIAGTLITSMNGGKDAMDALKDAISTFDKVITINSQGVAAYSDKFAMLAKVNANVATLMKTQAELELQGALSKVSAEVQKASESFITFGDQLVSSLGGGYASVKLFDSYLSTLNITTNDFSQAWKQAAASGMAGQTAMNSMISTVGALASRFDMTEQQAFEFAKQLSDIAKNPSETKLESLISTLEKVGAGHSAGAEKARDYAKQLLDIATSSLDAQQKLAALKSITDSLSGSQDKAIKSARQELFILKQTGTQQMQAKAWRDAENQGLKEGTQAFRDYYNVRLQTYQQQKTNADATKKETDAQNAANAAARKAESQADHNNKVLEEYSQKASLSADSTSDLSREQTILAATQKLINPTQAQIARVQTDAAAAWDKAAALKAQNAVPELKENADYQASNKSLETLKDQKDANGELILTQEQYNAASEQLEQQHQANLAKIRAEQNSGVTPLQDAQGQIDPVQQLANQHARELALIQQFETQKGAITQNGLALMNAANMQYEKARTDAQWALFTQQSIGYETLGAAVDAFSSSASSALSGVITGTESAGKAAQALANTILSSVIQTFVEMGVQQAKSAIMGATAQQSAIAATTAAQAAATAATTATSTAAAGSTLSAWLPAALVASVGSFGAAAIVGGAALASAFALSSVLGKRKNGGPVTAGGMYQVGESGLPEIYKASNGSQYMIPGDNGSVISNKDLQSGGGVSVVINFSDQTSGGSHAFNATADQSGQVVTIDAFLTDLDNGGAMSQGISNRFGLSRKATGSL